MTGQDVHAAEIVLLLLLLFVVAFAALARKLQTPYPIILVIAGLVLSFVPGMPRVTLDPEVIFFVVLPPLLYAAAWNTSWKDFRHNLVSIALLAIALVAFTVLGVAALAPALLPRFDWRIGLVLGAVVAPTDALAATSIAKRIGLPQRIVAVLEGESLVNDATGLLALEFALALIVYGRTPTIASGASRLIYLSVIGIAIGLVMGRIVEFFEHRIDDAPIEIAVSIFVPYATYMAADVIHASGVLAVVTAGLYLGRKSSQFFSPSVRLQAGAFWESLTFILNGLVFVLIGFQLPYVLADIREFNFTKLIVYAGVFSGLLILLRLFWSFPGAYVAYLVRTRILHQNEESPKPRQVFIIGWTGMRGVVALAAAISLPATLADGSPFPQRDLIIFLTFSVILVTLVLQGLTLPPLVRALGLAGATDHQLEEETARSLIIEAALKHLEEVRQNDDSNFGDLYDDLAKHYRHRLASLMHSGDGDGISSDHHARYLSLSRELLETERHAAQRLRNEGRVSADVLRELEYEIDLSETRLEAPEH
jgi:CPA1 family monovalent cation:H+ antiporter